MFPFFYILTNTCHFDSKLPERLGWYLIVVLVCISLLKMLNTFLYTCCFVYFLWKKMSIQILWPFLIRWLWQWWWYDDYFGYWVAWIYCILWILIPYQIHSLQRFLPSFGCLLILFKFFFCTDKTKSNQLFVWCSSNCLPLLLLPVILLSCPKIFVMTNECPVAFSYVLVSELMISCLTVVFNPFQVNFVSDIR